MKKESLRKLLIVIVLLMLMYVGYLLLNLRMADSGRNINSRQVETENVQQTKETYADIGISFDYPDRYVAERRASYVNLMEKEVYERIQDGEGPFQNAYVMGFTVYNNDANKELDEWVATYLSQNGLNDIRTQTVRVAEKEAVNFVIPDVESSDNVYVFKHPDSGKIVFFYYLEEFEADGERILDTLEFI